jgi:hypothetical protein
MTTDISSSWPYADKHVDSTISDGSKFTNAAHVVIFASVTGSGKPFRPIGVVQGWSFTEQRQMEEIFELGSDIKYIIPGRTNGQIAITRLLVNGPDLLNIMYATFGEDGNQTNSVLRSLKDINKPIDLVFVTYNNDTGSTEHMVRYFNNCWIAARQESITANQVVVLENCTVVYEKVDSTKITIATTNG